ncbi:fatty acid desaturase [Rhodococcus koreensis]
MNTDRLASYDLTGPEGDAAIEDGLVGAQWFKSTIPRKRMKELMRRSDRYATRNTAIWFGSLAAAGTAGAVAWATGNKALAVPALAAYGVLYGSASDPRWHEAGHGTFFATKWKNDALYQIASFMNMKDPTVWRWSHARHHTDTLIVGRDAEITVMRPARLARILLNMCGVIEVPLAFKDMVLHAARGASEAEKGFVPESEQAKVQRNAQAWLAIYGLTAASCVTTKSLIPALLIGLPRMYGAYMMYVYGLTQHAGLGENVLDHRLNTRTVKMGRINRFLYLNMNFHIEHHMFPMVPSDKLEDLHEEMKKDCPDPYPSLWAAYKEIVPAILKQLKDPSYFIKRELPEGAAPYHIPIPEADGHATSVGRIRTADDAVA